MHALRLSSLAVAMVVAAAAAASTGAAQRRLSSPVAADVARASAAIPDSTLAAPAARRLLARPSWGGTFVAANGERVNVEVSDAYPEDPVIAQRWADYLSSLVHGSELSRVTAYLAPIDEVELICGEDALACYSPDDEMLVAPGDDPGVDISAEAVVTHEYGHHVAANRSNAPWLALDWGTKRWATYEQICGRVRAGTVAPGAEQAMRYRLNPGEGFAESYRVLNQRRLGLPESPWVVVSRSFYPDAHALAVLQQDVTKPWGDRTTRTYAGRTSAIRTYRIATTLDGRLTVTVKPSAGTRVALALYRGTRRVGSSGRAVTTTVCGERSFRATVRRLAGSGSFRLTVERP